ncbi:excitatory amino acid transporter 3-like [Haliotis rubra]|uniref:excitatory amino acid transporter 3-like n=1 Tax=Haliotis rubra TaxID=36100 RepID=UPI001EE51FCE|nr:excitatory amino acid transporter 3-like [Haliotis rubra]
MCRQFTPTEETIRLVKFPGELFLRMLRLLMLPLVVASMITGLGNMKGAGRICLLAMLYYMATTVIALLIALAFVSTIKPGSNSRIITKDITQAEVRTSGTDMVLDVIRNVFPDNIIGAAIQHTRTITTGGDETVELTNTSLNGDDPELNITRNNPLVLKKTVVIGGVNIVGILTYSAVFGVFLSRMGPNGSVVLRFFNAINTITLNMVQLAMWFSPLGIMSMITGELLTSVSLRETGEVLALYIVTELAGLVVHSLLATPLLYLVLTRTNPFRVLGAAGQALITAFATSSSFTAILGSIGAAGVPGTSITTLLMVLNATGLPDTGMSFLLTINWLTERIRTSVNVAGDCLAVGVVSHFTKEVLAKSNVQSLEEQDEDSDGSMIENETVFL